MTIRTILASLAIAVVATLPLAGVAAARPDRNCPDFATQADAQQAFDSVPGDPERLDADGNGIACESLPGGPAAEPTTTPLDQLIAKQPAASPATAPTTTLKPSTPKPTTKPAVQPTTTLADPAAREPVAVAPARQGQVSVVPRGGVDTGDGSSSGFPLVVAGLGGMAALGATVAGRRRADR